MDKELRDRINRFKESKYREFYSSLRSMLIGNYISTNTLVSTKELSEILDIDEQGMVNELIKISASPTNLNVENILAGLGLTKNIDENKQLNELIKDAIIRTANESVVAFIEFGGILKKRKIDRYEEQTKILLNESLLFLKNVIDKNDCTISIRSPIILHSKLTFEDTLCLEEIYKILNTFVGFNSIRNHTVINATPHQLECLKQFLEKYRNKKITKLTKISNKFDEDCRVIVDEKSLRKMNKLSEHIRIIDFIIYTFDKLICPNFTCE